MWVANIDRLEAGTDLAHNKAMQGGIANARLDALALAAARLTGIAGEAG